MKQILLRVLMSSKRSLTLLTLLTLILIVSRGVNAQALTGTYGIPSHYPTLQAAIDDLNTKGVDASGSGVIFSIDPGYTETAPSGGYRVTATGTATTPIVFQKNGAGLNPVISAPVGTMPITSTTTIDGIWRFVGSDYITIDGIDVEDNNVMPTAASSAMHDFMEYGYGFFRASATDGCQYNTIKNCTITLSGLSGGTGQNIGGSNNLNGPSGILFASANDIALTTSIAATSTAGSHSFNKIQSNTLNTCYTAIGFFGTTVTSPYTNADWNNEIGGTSAPLGNTINGFGSSISNYFAASTTYNAGDVIMTQAGHVYKVTAGGTSGAAAPTSTSLNAAITNGGCTFYYLYTAVYVNAILVNNQYGMSISNNTMNNNPGPGTAPFVTGGRAIYLGPAPGASATVSNNTIQIRSACATSVDAIYNDAGATPNGNTISINNNTISVVMGMRPHATTGVLSVQPTGNLTLINNTKAPTNLNINDNVFVNDSSYSTSGTTYLIYNSAAIPGVLNINNNSLGMNYPGTTAYNSSIYGIYSTATTVASTISVNNNTFANYSFNTLTGAASSHYFMYVAGSSSTLSISNNTWNNVALSSGGAIYLIQNANAVQSALTVNNNSITTAFTINGAVPNFYGYYANGGSPKAGSTQIISGNNFSNISTTLATPGAGLFNGINSIESATSPYARKYVYDNTISNITYNSTGTNFYGIYLNYLGESINTGSKVYGNTVQDITTSAGSIHGINIATLNSPNYPVNVYQNTVSGIVNNGATSGTIYGLNLGAASVGTNAYRNKVGDLLTNATNGVVYGIFTGNLQPFSIYNNVVGDLHAPNSTNANAVNGIYITSGTTVNVSYNTVNIAGTLATNAGSNGIFANTAPTVTLRNNLVVNTSVASGTGLASAYKRSSATLTTYGAGSNNNIFYTTETAENPIYTDGTNTDITFAQYQSRVASRDANSLKENVTFSSTAFSSADFLHPDLSVPTNLEGGAQQIAGITTDFNDSIRAGNAGYAGLGSNPDVGAYEADYTGLVMIYDQTEVDQITVASLVGSANQEVLRIKISTQNASAPLSLSSLKLNTAGTTNTGNLLNARVYSTGGSGTFSPAVQFGSTVNTPNGVFYVNGSQTLNPGTNYFWVVYDVSATATPGNSMDARLDSVVIGSTYHAPANGDPAGNRTILDPLSGTYTIGVGAQYTNLTDAISDLNILGVNSAVTLALTPNYISSNETFPITFGEIAGVSASNTITVQPQTLAAGLVITSNNATATIDLNGARYITIDGRLGGSGSKNLTIDNSNTAGVAIRLVNDACFNTIIHNTISGVNTSTTAGAVVFFSTTTGTRGNDSNTVSYCDIRDGASNPANALLSAASAIAAAANNNNTVSNCNVFNFWSPNTESNAFKFTNGNTDWTFTGNSIYQTATLTATGTAPQYVWNVAGSTMNNMEVSNNYIGGSEPLCGGASPWTATGTSAYRLSVATLALASATPSSFSGNTITNINISSGTTAYSSGAGVFSGVYVTSGLVHITNNLIGTASGTGAITVNTAIGGDWIVPIGLATGSTGTMNIKQNTIGGITVVGSSASIHSSMFAITVTASTTSTTYNIDSNIIGNGTADNMILSTASTSSTGQQLAAVYSTAGTNLKIRYNTIQNFRNNAVGAAITPVNWVHGFDISGSSIDSIIGNTISALVCDATYQNNNSGSASIIGMRVIPATSGNYISDNRLSGFTQTSTGSQPVSAIGILTNSMTNTVVERNYIHSFSVSSTSTTATMVGIFIAGGTIRYTNNIIRLGIDSTGASVSASSLIYGVYKLTGVFRGFHNTIYIGGTVSGTGIANTFCYSSAAVGVDSVMNNIFMNERLNSSTGGTHYAMGVTANTTLTCNTNNYWADTLFLYGAVKHQALPTWTAATGLDVASISANPNFMNATGDYVSLDMHINATLPAAIEGAGTPVAMVNNDFYGQLRSSFTPTDIGAEAGNFILMDVSAPVIISPALGNTGLTSDRTVTATITDATGLSITGFNPPMIYYKKGFTGPVINDVGTFVSGTPQNGVWSFTISESALFGLLPNDSVYYYFVAVDSSVNLNYGSLPIGAGGSYGGPTEPAALFKYKILNSFTGIIPVGPGGTYPTLTGLGGAFEAINAGIVTGDITLEITDSITETGVVGLNQFTEEGTGNYTLHIVPGGPTMRVLAGNAAGALIILNGADRVTIDGSYGGSGKYLTFRNRSTGGVQTIRFINDAKHDTIRNAYIEGINQFATVYFAGALSGGTGNDSNAVTDCILSDTAFAPVGATIPNSVFYSDGPLNSENTIARNEISNYIFQGVNIGSGGTSNNNWVISGNAFYQGPTGAAKAGTGSTATQAVQLSSGNGHTISNNSIGGSAADRSGAAYKAMWNATNQVVFKAIELIVGTTTATTVSGNTIANIKSVATTSTSSMFNGIAITSGLVNITNNTIGGGLNAYDTIMEASNSSGGAIYVSGGTVTITGNTVGNISNYINNSGVSMRTTGISIVGGTSVTVTNNTIRDIRSGTAVFGTSTSTSHPGTSPCGIYVNAGTAPVTIDGNTIHTMVNTLATASPGASNGITISGGACTVVRNRIYNIYGEGTGTGTSAPYNYGILVTNVGNTFRNNQISMGANALGESWIYGIRDRAVAAGTNSYYYNSVYIDGASDAGSNPTFAMQRVSTTVTDLIRNNIFYNNRAITGSATGISYAFGSSSPLAFSANNLMHNLMLGSDTNRLIEYPLGTNLGVGDFNAMYTTTNNTNWMLPAANINATGLFTDVANGDLGINTAIQECWYVNGKGMAITGVSGDYTSAATTRATTIKDGTTDIGSVEFTTSTTPIAATPDASPAAGTTTSYWFGGRKVASIQWGAGGTVPTSVQVVHNSGTVHPNLISGRTQFTGYTSITPTGGSGYTAMVSVIADSAANGMVSDRPAARLAAYRSSDWSFDATSTTNAVTGMLTSGVFINGSVLSGDYTGTDNSNPLPVELTMFTATAAGKDVVLNWTTASEHNNIGFEIQRSVDGNQFEAVGFVNGKGNSTTLSGYRSIDQQAFDVASELYYRLKQIDADGKTAYSTVVRVSAGSMARQSVSAYPNPFTRSTQLMIETDVDCKATIAVTDISGRVVVSKVTDITKGATAIDVTEMESLQSGIYFIHTEVNGTSQSVKVVKAH